MFSNNRNWIQLFTDGITNKLVGCFHTDSKSSSPDVQQTTNIAKISAVQQDVVLVRVYGNKTDLLIDRKAETRNIQMLHSHGFAPCLYAIFRNGLAYEYVPGVTLTSETVAEPQVWSLIARHMAEMHKIQIDCGSDDQPMLCGKVQQFLDILPETYSDSQIDERWVFLLWFPLYDAQNLCKFYFGLCDFGLVRVVFPLSRCKNMQPSFISHWKHATR